MSASSWIEQRAHLLLPAIGAAVILAAQAPLLGPVIDRGGDNSDHLLAEYTLSNALAARDDPFGPLGVDLGAPLLRFYQAGFWLVVAGAHTAAGIDVRTAHNVLAALCFALSPFALCWGFRGIGLGRFAAGLGALAACASVGGFASSFEAYHGIGIATQAMGAFFLPLFLGAFSRMLRRENGVAKAALLFAAAFLSHAAVAIYAVLTGALYALVAPFGLRANWHRLAAFSALAAALVAFWALPFVSHTERMRAVPDASFRGDARLWWFTSVTEDEALRLAATGRLLDDERRPEGGAEGELDALLAKVSYMGSHRHRPPVMTALAALGLAVALARFRRTGERYLAAGLALSLMLYAGADDFPWLGTLPFIAHVQTVRCAYLVELFAYGLVGVGAEAVLAAALRAARARKGRTRVSLLGAWTAVAAGGIAWVAIETGSLGRTFVRVQDQAQVDEALDAARGIPDAGLPFRLYSAERWDVFPDYLASAGFRPMCTHWSGVGPNAALALCESLWRDPQKIDLLSLSGTRYVTGRAERVARYADAKAPDGAPLYRRLANGPDRRGAKNDHLFELDTGRAEFLGARADGLFAVVCDDAQWAWLVKAWLSRYGRRAGGEGAPMPLRVPRGGLDVAARLAAVRAVVYAAKPDSADLGALADASRLGKRVISTGPIPGVAAKRPGGSDAFWKAIDAAARGGGPSDPDAGISLSPSDRRSSQRFSFHVSSARPFVAVLPTEAVPGWTATADGNELPVLAAGPDLVAVAAPAGVRSLSFVWKMPSADAVALRTSLAALLVCAALAPLSRRRARTAQVPRGLGGFAHRHLVALALLVALAGSAVRVFALGTTPVPQSPPSGSAVYGRATELEWSSGTRACAQRLQIAVDDPSFSAPVVDEPVEGTSREIPHLRPGSRYSWRILCDGAPSDAATFAVPECSLGL